MPCKKACLLPILEGIYFPVGFILTFALAYINGDIPPGPAFLSNAGGRNVSRCIMTFVLSSGSLLVYFILYIRYRQVELVLESEDFLPTLKCLNKITLYCGSLSCFGLFLVACFPVLPFLSLHLVGAVIFFSFAWLMLALQTYVSCRIYPYLGTRCINCKRFIIFVVLGVTIVVNQVCGALAFMSLKEEDSTQWTKDSGGYGFYLISLTAEWTLVLGFVFYICLFYKEFKSLVIYEPELEIIYV